MINSPMKVFCEWTKVNGKRTKMLLATFAIHNEAEFYLERKRRHSIEHGLHQKPLEEMFYTKVSA